VTEVLWQGKHIFLLHSTNSDPRTDGSVTRKAGKGNEETEISCPQAVTNYTKRLRCVDVGDQRIEYFVFGRSSKIIVEIYITFCPKCVSCELFHFIPPDKSSFLYITGKQASDLQTKLGASAVTFTCRKRTGRKRTLPKGTAFPKFFQTLQNLLGRANLCDLCIGKKKKSPSGKGKQTTYKCKQCDIPLCRVGCFLEYHEQRNMEV